MIRREKLISALTSAVLFSFAGIAFAQTDPGVQSASRGTGVTIINPSDDPNGFTAFFNDGLTRFQAVETVSNSADVGLGPRFNSNSCSSCHRATCCWRNWRCRQSPVPIHQQRSFPGNSFSLPD